jgi:hypothetical protein
MRKIARVFGDFASRLASYGGEAIETLVEAVNVELARQAKDLGITPDDALRDVAGMRRDRRKGRGTKGGTPAPQGLS